MHFFQLKKPLTPPIIFSETSKTHMKMSSTFDDSKYSIIHLRDEDEKRLGLYIDFNNSWPGILNHIRTICRLSLSLQMLCMLRILFTLFHHVLLTYITIDFNLCNGRWETFPLFAFLSAAIFRLTKIHKKLTHSPPSRWTFWCDLRLT